MMLKQSWKEWIGNKGYIHKCSWYIERIWIKKKEKANKYNFQGQSSKSKRWFDIGHEWWGEKYFTREPEFYNTPYEINIEGQDMETYKFFVVPIGNNKITEEI